MFFCVCACSCVCTCACVCAYASACGRGLNTCTSIHHTKSTHEERSLRFVAGVPFYLEHECYGAPLRVLITIV